MTAKSASLSQLSFPIEPVSNVHWHVHLGLARPNSMLVKTWLIQQGGKEENMRHQLRPMEPEPRNLATQRRSSGHNTFGFSKGLCQGSTPKLLK